MEVTYSIYTCFKSSVLYHLNILLQYLHSFSFNVFLKIKCDVRDVYSERWYKSSHKFISSLYETGTSFLAMDSKKDLFLHILRKEKYLFIKQLNFLIWIGDISEHVCHTLCTFATSQIHSRQEVGISIIIIIHVMSHVQELRKLNFGMHIRPQFPVSFPCRSWYPHISHKNFWHVPSF